jgi:SAM-dependent methyltransferase
MKLIDNVHETRIKGRRAEVLSRRLAELMPQQARVLDVGCGNGLVAWSIRQVRPDVTIEGVDVLIQPDPRVPVRQFDGLHLPADDASFDVVMFVDVLHHTDDPRPLLAEARRVSRAAIVIKDHLREGLLANATLRLMDHVGNARFGIRLPYNYWSRKQWQDEFRTLQLDVEAWNEKLGLYPWPLTMWFDRLLHYIARLRVPGSTAAQR